MNEELRGLADIDFLPRQYREEKIKRSASLWRLIVVIALAGMLLSASFFQQRLLREAEADLAKIEPMHTAAKQLAKEMAEEQAKMPATDQEAEFLTYLRTPWPRTQILNAILEPVPKTVRFTSLGIQFELPERPAAEGTAAVKDDPVDKSPSPARDLKRLREQLDGGRWVVSLAGTATDLAELHMYMAHLERYKLFAKVELVSIESPHSAEAAHSRFAVRIVLRPAYGQPGGPAIGTEPSAKKSLTHRFSFGQQGTRT